MHHENGEERGNDVSLAISTELTDVTLGIKNKARYLSSNQLANIC